jgi:hypothetical protein
VVRSQARQIVPETLSWKKPSQNRVDGVDQIIKCLPRKPSKCEALSSSPTITKKKVILRVVPSFTWWLFSTQYIYILFARYNKEYISDNVSVPFFFFLNFG